MTAALRNATAPELQRHSRFSKKSCQFDDLVMRFWADPSVLKHFLIVKAQQNPHGSQNSNHHWSCRGDPRGEPKTNMKKHTNLKPQKLQ